MSPDEPSPTSTQARTAECGHRVAVSRRSLLGVAGAAGVALAGCLGGDGSERPDPVTLPDDATCDVCGMVIVQHPGPTAEVFYADRRPADHDNPARFDSTWEAFSFDFERENWSRRAFYVTDYSAVDSTVDESGAEPTISRHVEASSFADATGVTFVVGSSVVGAMGRDLLAFSDSEDADAFREQYGGETAAFDEVTPSLVAALGS